MSQSHARSLACALLLVAGSLVAATTPASANTSAADCPNIDATLTASNVMNIRATVLCLINVERARHGMRPVRQNAKLRKAARRHSADMVRAGYFAHIAPNGDTLVDRILATGYVRKHGGWALGENLAWCDGQSCTPRRVHAAWMHSRGHRANILKRSYREIGIGTHLGNPTDPAAGATFTTVFGVRS